MCEWKKERKKKKKERKVVVSHKHKNKNHHWVRESESVFWDLWDLTSSFKLPKKQHFSFFVIFFDAFFIWAFSVSSFSFISSFFNCLSHAFSMEGKGTTLNIWDSILRWGQLHDNHVHSCIVFNVWNKHPKSLSPKFKEGNRNLWAITTIFLIDFIQIIMEKKRLMLITLTINLIIYFYFDKLIFHYSTFSW